MYRNRSIYILSEVSWVSGKGTNETKLHDDKQRRINTRSTDTVTNVLKLFKHFFSELFRRQNSNRHYLTVTLYF
jgi:hypothetical protein